MLGILGCISDMFIDGEAVDFDKVEKKQSVQSGCSHTVDVCRGVECNKGVCVSNATMPLGYECHCELGYSGKHCENSKSIAFVYTTSSLNILPAKAISFFV